MDNQGSSIAFDPGSAHAVGIHGVLSGVSYRMNVDAMAMVLDDPRKADQPGPIRLPRILPPCSTRYASEPVCW